MVVVLVVPEMTDICYHDMNGCYNNRYYGTRHTFVLPPTTTSTIPNQPYASYYKKLGVPTRFYRTKGALCFSNYSLLLGIGRERAILVRYAHACFKNFVTGDSTQRCNGCIFLYLLLRM